MIWKTQREKLLDAYGVEGEDYILSTMPYHSAASLEFEVVEGDVNQGVAIAVARKGQEINFFDFGRNQRITMGADAQHKVTRADTNLTKANSTNGASDFVIEGIGLSCRAARIRYETNEFDWPISGSTPTDTDVLNALAGKAPVIDSASLFMPPQVQSPFNLENAPFQAALPFMSLLLNFDENTIKPLGTLDMLPQAGAASYLRANGEPSAENVFRIDEGYVWRREGQTDGEFYASVKTEEPLVMPITLCHPPGSTTEVIPDSIYLDIVMRVFGIEVEGVSQN